MAISEERIAELKAQHDELYVTSIGLDDVIFKALSVRDYKESLNIAEKESSVDAEEFILKVSILEPFLFDPDDYMIGEVNALADEVLELSGFSNLEVCSGKINEARELTEELVVFMKAMIIASSQQYSAEEIESMTFSQLAQATALAERIFEIQSQVARGEEVVLQITDGTEMQTKARGPRPVEMTPEEWEAVQRGEFTNPEKASTIGAAGADDPIARKLREALGG